VENTTRVMNEIQSQDTFVTLFQSIYKPLFCLTLWMI